MREEAQAHTVNAPNNRAASEMISYITQGFHSYYLSEMKAH